MQQACKTTVNGSAVNHVLACGGQRNSTYKIDGGTIASLSTSDGPTLATEKKA